MDHYTLWHALVGGILIGLASLLATVLSGKIPGISGVFGRLLVSATPDKTWRAVSFRPDWRRRAEFYPLAKRCPFSPDAPARCCGACRFTRRIWHPSRRRLHQRSRCLRRRRG